MLTVLPVRGKHFMTDQTGQTRIKPSASRSIDGILISSPIGMMLTDWARQFGGRTALIAGNTRLSFTELDHRVDRLAGAFQGLGLKAGDRILVQMPNDIGFVTILLASLRLGVVPILAMTAHRAHELNDLIKNAQPVAYFAPQELNGFRYNVFASSLQLAHPCLNLIVLDGPDPLTIYPQLSSLNAAPKYDRQPKLSDLALLLLSGGTTATPKLIPRTHADYAFTFLRSAEMAGVNASTVYLAILPGSHNFILSSPGILGVLAKGGRVVLTTSVACDEIMPLIEKEAVTHIALVPPLLRLWIDARKWERSDLSSLELLQIGGARIAPTLVRQARNVFETKIQQVYGMAEGLLCYTRFDDPEEVIFATQGRPMSDEDEILIVDDDGKPVKPGEIGELLTRGPYTISHYYNVTSHRDTSFTADGYYRTGDLVRQDATGNIIVMGRIKEQINRAGEKIAVSEIEIILSRHPQIDEAILVAAADQHLGERICAFLKGSPQNMPDSFIREYLRDYGVAAYKMPDQIIWISIWPQTAIGKIDRKKLVAIAEARTVEVSKENFTPLPDK